MVIFPPSSNVLSKPPHLRVAVPAMVSGTHNCSATCGRWCSIGLTRAQTETPDSQYVANRLLVRGAVELVEVGSRQTWFAGRALNPGLWHFGAGCDLLLLGAATHCYAHILSLPLPWPGGL
jgi:hypothetical protein